MYTKYALVFLATILFYSCSSVDPCPKNPAIGNSGSIFNTENDEYSPYFFENTIYYTAKSDGDKNPEKIFKSDFIDGKFTVPRIDTTLPLHGLEQGSLPRFYRKRNGDKALFFAANSSVNRKKNSNLFYAEESNGSWSEPIELEQLNTESYESHPAISNDGKLIVFASDREGGYGEIDLYFSLYTSGSGWMEPINLGSSINTEAVEISPYLAYDNTLYFASNRSDGLGSFDIWKAKFNGTKWEDPVLLEFPINTEYSETGPAIWNEQLYLSSDRRGGCGGRDLYTFELCRPIILEVLITGEDGSVPLDGSLFVLDEQGNKIYDFAVGSDGKVEMQLSPMQRYRLQYFNSCIPSYVPEQIIDAPCSDTKIIKMIAEFVMPNTMKKFVFEEYKVPFFVSGYYMPNTSDNLQSLRLKFEYGLLGNSPQTAYIEKPGQRYDEYAVEVENALNDASNHIYSLLENLSGECGNTETSKLKIRISGYADPRAISEKAIFNEDEIQDALLNFNLSKGTQMTNELLSQLRAYYTAKYLQDYLKNFKDYSKIKEKISWEISGLGVDNSSKFEEYDMMRRVIVEIGFSSE